jgi:peptidoglycan-associated lipoprotein
MKTQGMWIVMSGLVFLIITGCSSKNVTSTSDGTELSSSDGKSGFGTPGTGGGNSPRGGPLSGFSKKPGDESIAGTAPFMLSKADQSGVDSREARKTREDSRKQLVDIYFAYDRWGLSDEGKKNLSESAGFLKGHPKAKLLIEGHCDERGSAEYNLALGDKRAKEARQYLSDLGIHNPIAVTSYGKERPTCKEQDESCYSKNRRAHLLIEAD